MLLELVGAAVVGMVFERFGRPIFRRLQNRIESFRRVDLSPGALLEIPESELLEVDVEGRKFLLELGDTLPGTTREVMLRVATEFRWEVLGQKVRAAALRTLLSSGGLSEQEAAELLKNGGPWSDNYGPGSNIYDLERLVLMSTKALRHSTDALALFTLSEKANFISQNVGHHRGASLTESFRIIRARKISKDALLRSRQLGSLGAGDEKQLSEPSLTDTDRFWPPANGRLFER